MSKLQLYQRGGDLELREIADTSFVGCITPAAAGNNRVDPRVMTLFNTFNCTSPSREATEKIYTQILESIAMNSQMRLKLAFQRLHKLLFLFTIQSSRNYQELQLNSITSST